MADPAGEANRLPADQIGRGVAWGLAGAFFASLLFAIPKFAGAGVPAMEIAFIRYLAGFLLVAPIFAFSGIRERIAAPAAAGLGRAGRGRVALWFHVLRAVLAVTRLSLAIGAVQLMPLANAQAILMTNGVFMFLFASLMLKEPFEMRLAVPAVICLIGGVIAAKPDFSAGSTWLGIGPLLAFGSALLFGLETVVIRYTALRDSPLRIVFWINLIGAVILAPVAWYFWHGASAVIFAMLFAMGPVALIVQSSNIRAFAFARAAILVPVRYSMIIFSLLIGLVGFGEWPGMQSFFGMALIVGGGTTLALYNRARKKAA